MFIHYWKCLRREFHVCKTKYYNQFVANPSIALKQSTPNLHLTINEKVISWKSQKHWPKTKPKFDTENYACMKQAVEFTSLYSLTSYVGCSWDWKIVRAVCNIFNWTISLYMYKCCNSHTKKLNESHHG